MDLPKHLLSDYLEIGYICIIFILGVPLNVSVFLQQVLEYRTLIRSNKHDLNTAFLLQKIHLNIANLFILIFYCPTQMGWLITYRWLAGDFVCRFTQFFSMISFIISSNIVAVIGVDRLRNVLKMEAMWSGKACSRITGMGSVLKPVKILLTIAWMEAVICSLPQWWTWTEASLTPEWKQCVTVWEKWRHEHLGTNVTNATISPVNVSFVTEKLYLSAHLLLVFWLPFLVILISYFLIIIKLCKFSLSSMTEVPNEVYMNQSPSHGCIQLEENITTCISGSPVGVPQATNNIQKNYGALLHVEETNMERSESKAGTQLLARSCSHVPEWRVAMRSKMFGTASLIIFFYILCWLPYNLICLIEFFDPAVGEIVKLKGYWLQSFIVFNVVINPFLYGFGTITSFFIQCAVGIQTVCRRAGVRP